VVVETNAPSTSANVPSAEGSRGWRAVEEHREAQSRGRVEVFADYRLRVASVVRDYGMSAREQAPADSRSVHE
jgi:hypothetical protein